MISSRLQTDLFHWTDYNNNRYVVYTFDGKNRVVNIGTGNSEEVLYYYWECGDSVFSFETKTRTYFFNKDKSVTIFDINSTKQTIKLKRMDT